MAMALTDSAGVSGLPGGPGGIRVTPICRRHLRPAPRLGRQRHQRGRRSTTADSDLPTPVLPASLPVPVTAPRLQDLHGQSRPLDGSDFRVLIENVPGAARVLVVAIPLDRDAADAEPPRRHRGDRLRSSCSRALAVAAWLLIKRDLRPLETMAVTADAIAAGDLTRRVQPAEPRTEVGRLGLSLNTMLSRIEEAFAERAATEEKLRRFLADASHELRTPLTSIRGYSEVFDRAKDDPENLELAMRRIEEESKRMGVMVEELLVLARLGEGREPERAPVDLARVVDDTRERRARLRAGARDRARARRDSGRARRRPPAPPGRRQPPQQRDAPHARPRRRSACAVGSATATPPSTSPTTAPGSNRTWPPRCSSPSTARTSRVPARPAAPASASPSSPPSWRPTAARCGSTRRPAPGPRSR